MTERMLPTGIPVGPLSREREENAVEILREHPRRKDEPPLCYIPRLAVEMGFTFPVGEPRYPAALRYPAPVNEAWQEKRRRSLAAAGEMGEGAF